MEDPTLSPNNENGLNNDDNSKDENEESLFNLEDDDNKQELNEDNQLKCFLCKQLFNQPKFLSCTHTLCLQCCEKLFEKDQIQCPICQQITQVSNVNCLVDNYILIREIEENALKSGTIECRACTSNEKGVAHCSTCSSYLCGKCCQAHQYMKCFEQHHVRRLSQTNSNEENSREKCSIHSNNPMHYFCQTCSQNLCEQCLGFHPTPQHDLLKNPLEQLREDFHEKFNQIDQIRSNALANLDHQLTSHQHDYDKTRTQIDLAHTQYQQALNQVYKECLSSLSSLQRDEEMRLIDKLEKLQKGSQSFDDSRLVFERCLEKCTLNELFQLKKNLFDEKFHSFEDLFHIETSHDEQQQKKK